MKSGAERFAALFPGQLSERAGIGEDFCSRHPWAAELFEEISRRSGVDLAATYFGEGAADLHADRAAHPGVFAASLAALDVLEREHGLVPAASAGYSLGTYAAFVAAGALDRWEALDVLLEVFRILEEDPVPGRMGFVIGLSRPDVEDLVRAVTSDPDELCVANENAARQIVVSGTESAVRTVIDRARPASLKAEMLPMTCPMHTVRLAPAAARVERFVASRVRVRAPERDLFSPMLGRKVSGAEEARLVLGRQIAVPANWAATLRAMSDAGFRSFAEVGPGDVLTRLLRWTIRDGRGAVVEDTGSAAAFAAALLAPSVQASRAVPESAS